MLALARASLVGRTSTARERPCGGPRAAAACSRRAAGFRGPAGAGVSRRDGRPALRVQASAASPLPAAPADRHGGGHGELEATANSIVALPSPLTSWDPAAAAQPGGGSSEDAYDGAHEAQHPHDHGLAGVSQDEAFQQAVEQAAEQAVEQAVEQELATINQAVHTAFEAELETLNQTVEQAVETALLDRSFDIKANLNTAVALTGVILYWRGIWNIADTMLGTDNLMANVASVLVGLSVMLLFRIFKLPVAEFW